MATTVEWGTRIITVYQADLTSLGGDSYQLDTEAFKIELRDLEDSEQGVVHPAILNHSTSVTLDGIDYARIIEFINGYTITFEEKPSPYKVFLKGSNNNILTVANLGTVQIAPNNSAGLINVQEIQRSAFDEGVTIDETGGYSGTIYPIGTKSKPVNNLTDALIIAESYGFKTIYINGPLTIGVGDFSEGFSFEGSNTITAIVTINPAADVTNCGFVKCTITGTMDGQNMFRRCNINNINYVNGFISECALNGLITLGGDAQASILDCWSNIAGDTSYPEINMGGSGNSLALRNYSGGIGISNYSGGGNVSIDMSSGKVIVEDTVDAGNIYIRGVTYIVDESTGTATVYDFTVPTAEDNAAAVWDITANGFGTYGFLLRETFGHTEQRVYIDTELAQDGDGYQQSPHNEFHSALDHAETNGLQTLTILSDATVDRQLKNFDINGVGNPAIDLNDQIMTNSSFFECGLTGGYTGTLLAKQCQLSNLSGANGGFKECAIAGTVTIGANALFWESTALVVNVPFIVDMNGATVANAAFIDMKGGCSIYNMSNASDTIHIHGGNGKVTIDASCTEGTIVITGDFKVTNNSAGATVTVDGVQISSTKLDELWQVLGLDPDAPLTVNEDGSITVGDITINAVTTGITPDRQTVQTREP